MIFTIKGRNGINYRTVAAIAIFILSVVAANLLTTRYGFVPVGFGFLATAGTYAAGVALVTRDFIHDLGGMLWVWVAVGMGAVLSFAVADPFIAVASAVAFAVSEVVDTAIYTPLRKRAWRSAVIGSSIVGAIVDTALFLGLAFGAAAITPQAITGQLIGKVLWVAIPVALFGGIMRSRRSVA